MPARSKKIFKAKSSASLPTALVAGAAGFIGSHLCDTLIIQNCKVYGIDNWNTGKKENLKHLFGKKNFVFLEHDLNQPLKSPLPHIDYVFHLAGIEAYINGQDVSLETLLVNSLGTRRLLDIAKKNQAKFLLASTSDIFTGFASSDSLSQYFGSEHPQEEAYSHHEAKRFSEALVFEYFNRYRLDSRIVRLGLIYGPRMDLSSGNELAQLFRALLQEKPLKIPGQGLNSLRPIYISDVIYGLTKAMFSQSSAGQIFTLVNPQAINLLNLVYKLKQLFPQKKLEVEFTSDSEPLEPTSLPDQVFASQKNLGWIPKVELDQGITLTFKWLETKEFELPTALPSPSSEASPTLEELGITPAVSPLKPPLKSKRKRFKLPHIPLPSLKFSFPKRLRFSLPKINFSSKLKLIFFSLLLFLFILLSPFIFISASVYSGFRSLTRASQLTDVAQIAKTEKLTLKAQHNFDQSRGVLRRFQPLISVLGFKKTANNLDHLLSIGSRLSQGGLYLVRAGQAGTVVSQVVLHGQAGNLSEALRQIQINLDQAYSQFSFVESELQSGQELSSNRFVFLNQKLQALASSLPQTRRQLNQLRQVLPLVPSFIALDSKKTYLLLFQNSAELRPTGGFIGSYGILSFDQGKLLDFSLEDIYSADGQLKGYVEPPAPLKEYLGEESWFFRDSNWDPDFTVAARRAEWFLQKTTNRSVDGTIAVNLPAVRELLKATGPINLADYNEEITADNLFERAEYHSEIDFFPGSSQKKDFLGSLANEIFGQVQNAEAGELLQLFQALQTALSQKQLLVYLHDVDAQKILLEQNWAGSLFQPSPQLSAPGQPIFLDYSYLVEANLGINKANYFVKKDLSHELTILKTKEVIVTSDVTYDNQSPADAWPGGIYRAYLRQYLPRDAKLISVVANGSSLSLVKDIDTVFQADKQIIGFSISVPVKSSLQLEIAYRLPGQLDTSQKQARLAVVIPKQPGTLADPIKVVVNYPSFLTVLATSPQALASPQVLTFQSSLETDRVFVVDFLAD